jgi:hypothetical protein
MCFSSSNQGPDPSIWQEARRPPTQPGLFSRLANRSGI